MAAERFRRKCEDSLRRLEEFPESGRTIPEFPELPHREVIVRPYRFFYRTSGGPVGPVVRWSASVPWPLDTRLCGIAPTCF
jgi:toxin ParE1/3/4